MHKVRKYQYGDALNYINWFNNSVMKRYAPNEKVPNLPLEALAPKTVSAIPGNQLNPKGMFESNKILSKTGSTAISPKFGLNGALGMASGAMDALTSFVPKLDHTTTANTIIDIGSNIAKAIPGPWGAGISAGLKAINLIDTISGKKSHQQATTGATAMGYNLDFNENAGTKYGGLFGNKKRKLTDLLTKREDVSNINKMAASTSAQKNALAAMNSASNVMSKNYNMLSGLNSIRAISAKEGTKLELQRIKESAQPKENVIPSGALHRELNHMDGEHTRKGIPVMSDDGIQQAEIEREELILNKKVTTQLERLLEDFNNGNEDAAIEAGKILTYEILKNTKDNTGLLNNINYEK